MDRDEQIDGDVKACARAVNAQATKVMEIGNLVKAQKEKMESVGNTIAEMRIQIAVEKEINEARDSATLAQRRTYKIQ